MLQARVVTSSTDPVGSLDYAPSIDALKQQLTSSSSSSTLPPDAIPLRLETPVISTTKRKPKRKPVVFEFQQDSTAPTPVVRPITVPKPPSTKRHKGKKTNASSSSSRVLP